jgi:probable rRNA maturation factor
VERVVKWIFEALGNREGEVSVVFLDDSRMAELNREYLKRDGATDVLAFPMAEGEFGHITPGMWGDVVICAPRALEQSTELGFSIAEELGALLIHGVLHLMGYNHEGVHPEVAERMRMLEAQLFDQTFGKNGIFTGQGAMGSE